MCDPLVVGHRGLQCFDGLVGEPDGGLYFNEQWRQRLRRRSISRCAEFRQDGTQRWACDIEGMVGVFLFLWVLS